MINELGLTGRSVTLSMNTRIGLIKAGLHEVVVNERTVEVIEQRKEKFPDRPLIRISSTFFWHLSSDIDLKPIPELKERAGTLRALNHEDAEEYPPMKVGAQVQLYVQISTLPLGYYMVC
jgi:hypothetical protein